MKIEPGTAIGPYTVVSKLGEGGMGEVYRARDSKLKREVAIKVLPVGVAGDPERLARFQREAEVLASLNHPNIAHVYGVEDPSTSSGRAALVMELVEGEDLSQKIAPGSGTRDRGTGLPMDEALAIAKQIAEALEAAHDAGIVHRDLKPANIKVRPDGTVKVLDFGLAKALETPGAGNREPGAGRDPDNSPTITSPAMTMHGMILGTAAYMAPEQAKGKPVDKRADIWAFGCVLYEMLTGRRTFEGEDVTDTIAAVVTKEPDWSRLPAATPAGVRRLLARALTKDRKHRLRDIGDTHYELSDHAAPGVSAPPTRSPRAAWLAAGAAAIAAAVLALPAMSHWRERPAAPPAMRLTIDGPANALRLLSPEISPDGRTIAFNSLARGNPAPQVWIRRLGETDPKLVPNSPFSTGGLIWSPSSNALAVPSRNGLLHLDPETGATRLLADLSSTMVGQSLFAGSWGREGVLIYGHNGRVFRVSEAGGDAREIELAGLPDGEVRFPVFLPDGRRFLFLWRPAEGASHLYAASIDGGPATRLFPSDSQGIYTEPLPGRGHVLYAQGDNLMAQPFDAVGLASRGNAFIVVSGVQTVSSEFIGSMRGAFSVSSDGVVVYMSQAETPQQPLVWLDREGKEIGTLGDPAIYFGPRLSPDGRQVAVARIDARTRLGDIYVLNEGGDSQRLTFDEANDLQPVWSPEGRFVFWGSQRGSTSVLVRRRADGSGAEEIIHQSAEPIAPDDVTPDGRNLVFRQSSNTTRNDLWILPLDKSGPAWPLLRTAADEPRARFSPDGKLIGYLSDATGRIETYLQPFPAMDGKWQIPGGGLPPWRRDGRELYSSAATMITSRTVISSNPLRLGAATQLFTMPPTPRGSFFHVSPDGQRFVFATDRSTADALRYTLAVGWLQP